MGFYMVKWLIDMTIIMILTSISIIVIGGVYMATWFVFGFMGIAILTVVLLALVLLVNFYGD